jgi:hypothetical protein
MAGKLTNCVSGCRLGSRSGSSMTSALQDNTKIAETATSQRDRRTRHLHSRKRNRPQYNNGLQRRYNRRFLSRSHTMRFALLAALLCTALYGCGQKGPLFIPSDAPPPSQLSQ